MLFRSAENNAASTRATLTAARRHLLILGLSDSAIDALSKKPGLGATFSLNAPIDGVVVERNATIGATVGTRIGRGARNWLERTVLERIPGYGVIRSLTNQMAGSSRESTWRAALVEIEDALVPGFIIEEFEDGRYTVFIPSIPTPFAGAVYVLDRQRVHPVDVPFTDAIRVISRWGSGAKSLVAAMERAESVAPR